jgi:lysophospholipase L1-like esterase
MAFDNEHCNAKGYELIARNLAEKIVAEGYIRVRKGPTGLNAN